MLHIDWQWKPSYNNHLFLATDWNVFADEWSDLQVVTCRFLLYQELVQTTLNLKKVLIEVVFL